jgi:hypothetical protein
VLTLQNVREEINSRLGGSQLDVELNQDDIDRAVAEAVRNYSRNVPLVRWRALPATAAQKRYVLDTVTDHPGLTGVIDLQVITRRTDPSAIDPFDPYDTVIGGLLVGDETFGDIAQRLAYLEDAQRVVSAEPEWRGQWEGNVYALYVDIVREPALVSYQWAGAYTPDANANTGMQLLPEHDTDWVLDYTEARCMVTLGRVRRKFGGIPNSEGAVDEVDGREMADEGQVRMTDLMDELRQRRFPLPIIME